MYILILICIKCIKFMDVYRLHSFGPMENSKKIEENTTPQTRFKKTQLHISSSYSSRSKKNIQILRMEKSKLRLAFFLKKTS